MVWPLNKGPTMRKMLAMILLFVTSFCPAYAATFTISGIASGLYYDFVPGPCTGGNCQTVSPFSFQFSYDLSDPAYSAVITGSDTIGYDFTAFLPLAGSSPATGRIVRVGNGYVGQSLSQSQFGYFGLWVRGTSIFAPQFNVASDTAPSVPEPSTWAMLIAGLGVVGAAIRRRRQHGPLQLA